MYRSSTQLNEKCSDLGDTSLGKTAIKHSLAIRLLRIVFSIYLLITCAITSVQMTNEYLFEKDSIRENLMAYQSIFYEGIANALWNFDFKQLNAMMDGVYKLHDIEGLYVFDGKGKLVLTRGFENQAPSADSAASDRLGSTDEKAQQVPTQHGVSSLKALSYDQMEQRGLFSYTFPVVFYDENIGSVTLFSSNRIVFNQVKYNFLTIIINAIIKTIILWLLFIWAFKRFLVRALDSFISKMESTTLDNPGGAEIELQTFGAYELERFRDVFNHMTQRIVKSKYSLEKLNDELERKVEERTKETLLKQEMLEQMSQQGRIGAWEWRIEEQQLHWSTMTRIIHDVDQDFIPTASSVWWFIKEEDKRALIQQCLSDCIKDGKAWSEELQIVTAKGEDVWVVITGSGIFEDGKCVRLYGSYQDINERIKVRHDLEEAKELAESGAKMKSQFLATMSHEIRTPMNGVLGMLYLLKNTDLDEKQAGYADVATTSGEFLLGLIDDILDLSKIEAGHIELEHLNFNIVSVLGDIAKSFGIKTYNQGIQLILDTSEVPNIQVCGDFGRIRQVVSNLMGNAVKFTSSGHILIRATLTDVGPQWQLDCYVEDTGIGIRADKVHSIFEHFTQVDASTTRKYGGTGLGLSISRELCRLMQGDIDVSSELDRGSTFHFHVRLEKAPVTPVNAFGLNDMKDAFTAKRVLVADPYPMSREVLERQLNAWQIDVVFAPSWHVLISILSDELEAPFDVVFLDSALALSVDPASALMYGRVLRKQAWVLMQPMGNEQDKIDIPQVNWMERLEKPIVSEEIKRVLADVLNKRAADPGASPELTRGGGQVVELKGRNNNPTDSHATPWPESTRILLVEDNDINRLVASGMLEKIGLQNDFAVNGDDALSVLQSSSTECPFDLILMDCQMPVMDGYEATGRIRKGEAGERYRSIPIVAMTANAMEGDRELCIHAGMDDYLTKPVDPLILLEKLLQWLPSRTS